MTPSADTTCPRYTTSHQKSSHFLGFNFRLAALSRPNTSQRRKISSSKVLPWTKISSRYMRQVVHGKPDRTDFISLSNVAGTLHKLNGITVSCHKPLPVEKAVFSLASLSRSTCQYPLLSSNKENHFEPANVASSIWDIGKHRGSCHTGLMSPVSIV